MGVATTTQAENVHRMGNMATRAGLVVGLLFAFSAFGKGRYDTHCGAFRRTRRRGDADGRVEIHI